MNDNAPVYSIHEVGLHAKDRFRDEWVRLRHALWGDGMEDLDAQLNRLGELDVPYVGFLMCSPTGEAVAFCEAALRPYVNGCNTSPVVFLEGLFVNPELRRQGLARRLVARVESWGRELGCTEFASDIRAENHVSHAAHLALG